METTTIQFKADEMFIARLLLEIHFEKDLYQFNQKFLSCIEKPFTYIVTKQVIWVINDFIRKVPDDVLKRVIERHMVNWEMGKDIKDTQRFFKLMLSTPEFNELLQTHVFTDSYVIDKTTNLEYPVRGIGNHSTAIYSIIALHPELDTVEKQDEFIMNQLIVKGAASSNDYYISDHGDMLAKEIEAIDKQQTVLSYLEMAEEQFNFKSQNATTPCYYVSYGTDYDWNVDTYSDWNSLMMDLYIYSNSMVEEYFQYHQMDEFDNMDSHIKEMGKRLPNHHKDADIVTIHRIEDIERKTQLFLETV